MMKESLTSTLMHRLSMFHLQSSSRKLGFHTGTRRSNRSGTSLEFSDYRFYQPGDDLRKIDWNIYARTNKHYIKQFLDEKELVVSIYLDCTKSMSLYSKKWNIAKGLATSLGYMALTSDDRVGVFPVGSPSPPFYYKKGRAFANRLIHYMENIPSSNSSDPFSETVPSYIYPKSSISIIISDLLEPIELMEEALKKVQAYQQELYVIQLLSDEEINPHFQGDLQLIDSETDENLNVTMSTAVKRQYNQSLEHHVKKIERFCFSRGIGFIQCHSSHSLEDILFKQLTSKGWIQ